MGFFGNFAKTKLSGIQENIAKVVVAWDPNGATEAEISTMIEELNKVTVDYGKAKSAYDKEKAEAVAARANYDRYISAAEKLSAQVDTEADPIRKSELEKSLTSLLSKLEELQPEVEREEQEAVEAEQYHAEMKEFAELTANKVKTARAALANAQKDMQRAEIAQQKAEDRAARAEVVAGLKKNTGALGVAMNAMHQQAAEARAKADAASLKADLLGQAKKEDENVAAALRAVDGNPEPTASVADRLAVLKKK
jgi:DNA repair exonuclease SbcCD ATPase subunit